MKKIRKIIFSTVLLIALAFIAVSCGENTTLKDAKEDLKIAFAEGDSQNAVTKDLVGLPSEDGDVTITWESSNSSVVNVNKTVVRPLEDTKVTLTATLTYKKEVDTKKFELTVLGLDLLKDAQKALELTFAEGDSANSVTEDLTLPKKAGDVTITWKSSDDFVLEDDGTVIREELDIEVTLTATLKLGDRTLTKDFSLTVKGLHLAAAKADLIANYANTLGNIEWKAVENVELVKKINGYDVTWSSNNEDFFTSAGVVTRPSFKEGDKQIALTATINGTETHVFRFVVEKLEQTSAEKIEEQLDFVMISPSFESGYQEVDFEIVTKVTIDGIEVAVTWVSSDESVMTSEGVLAIFADADEKSVTLTATITYDGVTLSRDKEFLVEKTVIEFRGESFAEHVIEANKGKTAYVEGVFLYGELTNGYYLSDRSGHLVYINGLSTKPEYDQAYDVLFEVDNYFNSLQIKAPKYYKVDTDVSGVEVPYVEKTVAQITGLTLPGEGNAYGHDTFKLKNVKIVVDKDNSDQNYNVFIVDKDFDVVSGKLSNKNSIMIYYTSPDFAELRKIEEATISEFDVVLEGYRTDKNIWYVSYLFNVEKDLDFTFTDEQKITFAKNNINLPSQIFLDNPKDLDLFTKFDFDITLTWTSSNEDLINPTTGKVTLPTTGVVEVELEVVIALPGDGADGTFTYKVEVGKLSTSTVEDVKDSNKGYVSVVEVVVLGMGGNNQIIAQDATGGITLFGFALGGFKLDEDVVKIGDKIKVRGEKDLYNGLQQLRNLTLLEITEGTLPEPTNIDEIKLDEAGLLEHQSTKVSLTEMLITKYNKDDYDNVQMDLIRHDGEKIQLRWDSRVKVTENDLLDLEAGKVVKVTNASVAWFNGPQLFYGSETTVTAIDAANYSDELSVYIVSEGIEIETTFAENGTIIWPEESLGVTITREYVDQANALNSAVNLDTGAVDVTNSGIVSILALVKKGDAEVELEFKLKLGEVSYEVLNTWDFGSTAKTGYIAGELKWTNTDGTEVIVNKDRVQTNTSTYVPHDEVGPVMILSIRNTHSEAWFEFEIDNEEVKQISFGINLWNNTLIQTVKDTPNGLFILQIKDGNDWINVKTTNEEENLLPLLVANTYVDVEFNIEQTGEYRIIYSGTSDINGNTTHAVTINEINFLG